MIIVDDSKELDSLLQDIKNESHVLVVPILADHQLHPSVNKISCIYVYSSNEIEAKGDALYLAMLGKASGGTGELFYKLGIARVDLDVSTQCVSEDATTQCSQADSIAAGIIGLGYDYYVGLKSMVRIEYVHMAGEDSFSTNMVNIGFRYNFN